MSLGVDVDVPIAGLKLPGLIWGQGRFPVNRVLHRIPLFDQPDQHGSILARLSGAMEVEPWWLDQKGRCRQPILDREEGPVRIRLGRGYATGPSRCTQVMLGIKSNKDNARGQNEITTTTRVRKLNWSMNARMSAPSSAKRRCLENAYY